VALVSSLKPKRIPIPHEEGQWLEIKPLSAGEFANADSSLSARQFSLSLMQLLIVGWSYEAPVTPEAIADLDALTFSWLDDQLLELSGLRGPDEKKGLNGNSSPTTDPEPDDSPANSDTSAK
jgi:hypothetical protein